jgi:hypothetical protein
VRCNSGTNEIVTLTCLRTAALESARRPRRTPSPMFTLFDDSSKTVRPNPLTTANHQEVSVFNAQRRDAKVGNHLVSDLVSNWIVLVTVKLNRQICFCAIEVQNVRTDRVLASKFESELPTADRPPKYDLAHRSPTPKRSSPLRSHQTILSDHVHHCQVTTKCNWYPHQTQNTLLALRGSRGEARLRRLQEKQRRSNK